ncbi:hypothetical protein ACHAXR_006753 [Thalassiosira sp. AJA248-18]
MALSLHNNNNEDAATSEEDETNRAINLSENILHSLRRRTPTSDDALLNLETDFYDPTTGLHSEGVWHNCLVGMASAKLSELKKKQTDDDDGGDGREHDEHLSAALRIAESLWEHSWDGRSFQRRSWSGLWDHSRLEEGNENPPEQANYYQASAENRCIQHGIALMFWSKLIHHDYLQQSRDNQEVRFRLHAQYKLIAKQFLHEYWDKSRKKWRTVSKSQGGGMLSRKSASAGKAPSLAAGVGIDTSVESPYYRAVDQAIGLLACLEMMKDDDVADIIRSTCQTLLSEFGYQTENEIVTYIGLDRNRNLWHDGWVALALASCTRMHPATINSDAQEQVGLLIDRLQEVYCDEESGTMWHWANAKKPGHDGGNVRYCGDNALWYAICREWGQGPSNNMYHSFWNFVHELQSNSKDGLVSVADVYHQVRLHPNTELAFLISWSM